MAVFPSVFGRLFSSGSSNPHAVGISMKTYRSQVMRDLRWLLNSRCHPRGSLVHAYQQVASSTVNYGLQDMVGSLESQVEAEDMVLAVKTAIIRFETRIIASSVVVSLVGGIHAFNADFFALEIQGDLWALPVNEPLTLRSLWNGVAGRWLVE
ncbi:MAG: type VI secretion system baseplate subunit TssE [Verrucomicrobia bacterium]|nr:type VI secretion system baseplate subunit TssE [Verrucomicrobiota bacterium]